MIGSRMSSRESIQDSPRPFQAFLAMHEIEAWGGTNRTIHLLAARSSEERRTNARERHIKTISGLQNILVNNQCQILLGFSNHEFIFWYLWRKTANFVFLILNKQILQLSLAWFNCCSSTNCYCCGIM